MKRLFLFAIGGTGARVVRSLTMMLAAGVDGLDSSYEIVPLIIDYDLSNGDKARAVETLKSYVSIHNTLYPNSVQRQNGTANYADHFFMTGMSPLPSNDAEHPYEFFFGPQTTEKFTQYLRKSALNTNPATALTESLLEALYDTSDDKSKDAELELDMAKGFKGNPNIGAVVFHELKHSPEYQRFAGTFNPSDDKIFIISSIFGGTGASGFPELVNAMRSDTQHTTLRTATIGAALILPYFKLQPFDPDKGDVGAIEAAAFNAKTRAALGYYATSNGINSKVNAIYYVGDENQDDYEYAEGEERQKNKAHIVEAVAATAIIDFLKNNRNHGAYEFSVKDAKLESSIYLTDFDNTTYSLVLDNLSEFAIAMKYYRDVICGDRNKINSGVAFYNTFDLSNQIGRGVWAEIDNFLLSSAENQWGFYAWLNELRDHVHSIDLYRMDKSKDITHIFAPNEYKVKLWEKNPLSDKEISSILNIHSRNVTQPTNSLFLKVLRNVTKQIYKNL
ncbi:MAG: hypothetical protein IKO26_06585 [Paludibacteraceae bacterium]|nr:hypothetical protein [Paludibacteraceae bacterium]